jgi:small-conductance mechanosensitive channel
VLILGWYFLRDFVSGIILKTEIPFEINQRIKIPQAEGILRKMSYRSIDVETDQGGLVKIPYSQLTTNAINLQNIDKSMLGNETQLRLKSSLPIQDVKDKIVKSILLLPWASINREPQIKVIEQSEEYNTFVVIFYSISNRHAAYICQHLKNYFESDTFSLSEVG